MATYTFDPALATLEDQVRNRIGDVDGQPRWFLANETIQANLNKYGYDETCAQGAESIAAQCAQLATETQQRNLRIKYQERSKAMFTLADRIRNLAAPDPTEPANQGAMTVQLAAPDLSNYNLGLPYGDANQPGSGRPGLF